MQPIFGKPIAGDILDRTRGIIREHSIHPGLAVVMVGSDPASEIYVGLKERAAEFVGMHFEKHVLSDGSQTEDVMSVIQQLNKRSDIHGIIVQLPLPTGIDTDTVIASIHPKKDADGFHPETVARFLSGESRVPPVFPRAILTLIEDTKITLSGKRAVIFANSTRFADIVSTMFARLGVQVEDSITLGTDAALSRASKADIVVTAIGNPYFLHGNMIRPGAIVVDGGISRVDGIVMGDTDPESFSRSDCFLAPVPGGVGPVTVALLISRVVELVLVSKNDESIVKV